MQIVYTIHLDDSQTDDETRVPTFESSLRRLLNEFHDLEPVLSAATERFIMKPDEIRKMCET